MSQKIIDLRSDTVTTPTEEMRQAMYQAEVGDDVFGEDPTVNRLEEMAAAMTGKEAALLTVSGTMSNLIAVLSQTRHGDEIVLGSEAHIFWNEVGGVSALGGVVMRTVVNDAGGRMAIEDITAAIRGKNLHYPPTTLVCLENSHNRCGGSVLTAGCTDEVSALARRHGLGLHLDGARLFNAAVALGLPASTLATGTSSVSFCLSKGLSAPVGSLLCANKELINHARKWRKMLGGGMRQAGVIAAAGIVALEMMIPRLAEDHQNARCLALGLANIPGVVVDPERVQTNIVIFEPPPAFSASDFIREMDCAGLRLTYPGGRRVRAVTHRLISTEDIDEALRRVSALVK